MRRTVAMTLFVVLCCLGWAGAGESAKDAALLQGHWNVTSATANGKDEKQPGKYQLIFKGDTFKLLVDGKELSVGTFQLDAAKDPKQMDLTIAKSPAKDEIGKKVLAIYKIGQGSLTFCGSDPGNSKRPDEFKSSAGSGRLLMTLQPAKEK